MSPFTVIEGHRDNYKVVCTWCASCFATKTELKKHWQKSKRCQANKTVNNPTQTKLGVPDLIVEQPGEAVLHLTRAATCNHETKRPLLDSEGNTIGQQCMYCYTRFD
jgi:hypothetical protein